MSSIIDRISPREPAYQDNDLMPFGAHQRAGKTLEQVPASYLLWLWEQGPNHDKKLDNYIFNNLDALLSEHDDHILKRKS